MLAHALSLYCSCTDPLGLSENRYREDGLKHKRIAMLGVAGYVNAEIFRWPGEIAHGLKFADVPWIESPRRHSGSRVVPDVILDWCCGLLRIPHVPDNGIPDLEPEVMETRKLQELQHDRLGMLAFLELVRHDAHNLSNQAWTEA